MKKKYLKARFYLHHEVYRELRDFVYLYFDGNYSSAISYLLFAELEYDGHLKTFVPRKPLKKSDK